ncbi:YcnI family copper-binding membrane protein [Gordonia rubripertincta]|uniref:YcnI family copper-binding membrane protein n=1 Tax=Gordonia rubripertincta TaxID=36822 RepID=UPI000B8D85D3|nr:YcnI family protein [Gordonia rubripertincta]ASR01709.1 hypothetical protein GCWB2_04415 [Gordonia rubripertincta]
MVVSTAPNSVSLTRRAPAVRRGVVVAVLSALMFGLVLLAGVAPATAHVSVDPSTQPARGGYGQVALVVPNESDTASTVGVTVTIPSDVEIASARTLPIPGWAASIERVRVGDSERIASITWTAASPDAAIKPAEFGVFTFAGGPWPDAESVTLATDQRYGDGEVVSWNEIAVDQQSEPEHPAPVLVLGAASDGHDSHGAHSAGDEAAGESESGFGWSQILSVVALVVAVASLAGLLIVARRPARGSDS